MYNVIRANESGGSLENALCHVGSPRFRSRSHCWLVYFQYVVATPAWRTHPLGVVLGFFASQREAILKQEIDLIYANPFDAAMLVRDQGFIAIAAPLSTSDEAVIAVNIDSPIQHVEDLKPGTRIASTDDPDVNLISMIMLKFTDLSSANVQTTTVNTYVLVAKQLLQGKADVGFS